MGVYIEGLELPKEFGNYYGHYTLCISEDGVNILGVDEKLYSVVEVKAPHGRLKDVDAILQEKGNKIQMVMEGDYLYHETIIQNAPTIIEAEGKDDG